MPDKFFYKGIPSLNGTIVPDDVFDILMPLCSGAEFKVLAYIVRRTFGFKKESDTISLKQMIDGITKRDGEVLDHGTGLSKATAAVAIKGLVEKGIIEAHRNRSKEKGDEPTTYRLRFEEKYPVSKNQTGGCIKNGQGGVQKSDPQQTVLQTTDLQFRNSNSKLDKYESKDNKGYRDFKTMGDLLKNKMAKKKLDIHQVPESLKITIDEISENLARKETFDQTSPIYCELSKNRERTQKGLLRTYMKREASRNSRGV